MGSPAPGPEHIRGKGHKVRRFCPHDKVQGRFIGHMEMEKSHLTAQAAGAGMGKSPFT